MEALATIAVGAAVALILIRMECATRKNTALSKDDACFFYKQGFCDDKEDFDHAWRWYQELFKKGH